MRVLLVSADRTSATGHAINVGDALLSDALADALRHAGHDVTVADFGSDRVSSDGARSRVDGIPALFALVRNHDAVVVGGGTMIQIDSPHLLRGSLMRLCAAVSIAAHLARRPLYFFAVGCDPLPRRLARVGYAVATWRRTVWVRDAASAQRFEGYFRRPARLGADAALLLAPGALEPGTRDRGLVLAPNRRDGAQIDEGLIDSVQDAYDTVGIVPMSSAEIDDLDLVPETALGRMEKISPDLGWRHVAEAIAGCEAIVASRMHALYIAMLTGRRMVAVGESTKVKAFADEFGVPRVATFADYRPGLEAVADSGALKLATDRARTSLDDLAAMITTGRR